jgi:hypothetical protein
MTTPLISIQLNFKPNFQIRFLFRNGGRTFYPPIILIELRLDNDYSISYLKTWHGHFCSWCMFKKVPELSYKVQVKARSGKVDLHFQWLWFWSSRFKFRFIFFHLLANSISSAWWCLKLSYRPFWERSFDSHVFLHFFLPGTSKKRIVTYHYKF